MFTFALVAAAVLHDPNPDDVRRFGFELRPVTQSLPRLIWMDAKARHQEIDRCVSGWLIKDKEREFQESFDDSRWRKRVWDAMDDLSRDCCPSQGRARAARELKEELGPVAYYLGWLPPSMP